MIDDARFERLTLSWIAEGPTAAPAETVQAAMAEIARTGQDRSGPLPIWLPGRPPTPQAAVRVALIAAATVVAVALLFSLAVIGGRPSPTVVPTPSNGRSSAPPTALAIAPTIGPSNAPSPTLKPAPTVVPGPRLDLSSTFTSPRYGYTIGIDADWTTEPATITWSGPDNSNHVLDHVFVTGKDTNIAGASQALQPGQTFDGWLDLFETQNQISQEPCSGGSPATWPAVQIGSATWRWQQMCQADVAITEQGGRVYVFNANYGMQGNDLTPSQYLQVLGTIAFDPASIPSPEPAPALDATFTSHRNGYSLRYPSGWTTKQATAAAPHDFRPAVDDPSWDVLGNAAVRLTVTSVPLNPAETTDDWIRTYCGFSRTTWTPPCEGAPGIWWATPFGSDAGWIATDGDGAGSYPEAESRTYQAMAVKDGRAYEVRLEGNAGSEVIRSILASMQLDPAAAVGASPAP